MEPKRYLSDEQYWALRVREVYNRQLESGVEEPELGDHLIFSIPGGTAFEELGRLGLTTVSYRDGVRIEPHSKTPRRGRDAVLEIDQVDELLTNGEVL